MPALPPGFELEDSPSAPAASAAGSPSSAIPPGFEPEASPPSPATPSSNAPTTPAPKTPALPDGFELEAPPPPAHPNYVLTPSLMAVNPDTGNRMFEDQAFDEIRRTPGLSPAGRRAVLEKYQDRAMQAVPTPQQFAATPVSGFRGGVETIAQAGQSAAKSALSALAAPAKLIAPGTVNDFEAGVERTYPTAPTIANKVAGFAGGAVPLAAESALTGPGAILTPLVHGALSGAGDVRGDVARMREQGEDVSGGAEAAGALVGGAIFRFSRFVPAPTAPCARAAPTPAPSFLAAW